MNELEHFFKNEEHRLIHKWNHYFEIYDRHLKHLKDRKINILEIGVCHGGSLQMWDFYFKGNAFVYGIDINPECKKLENENVQIFIGSQEDEQFLETIKRTIPKVDVLIDDGGHTMKQQVNTLKYLFDHVADDGIYICEDLHTSYWKSFGGGYKKKRSFIEFSKNFIDKIHAWHSPKISVDHFTRSTHSLHYYDSMLVIEKRKMTPPFDVKSGVACIADQSSKELQVKLK
ncbi:MAG: class I SAM-dependent methyltransferase [Ferruginibacter sp.]|nr:class I SAM-dependent methyltransferase [Ferruginibacter sp.]